MKTTSIVLCTSLLLGCELLADGTIDKTCDDSKTCGAISEGGVVFVEQSDASGDWRVSLRNGVGEEIEYFEGQGSNVGGVVYEASQETVYLSEGQNIRVLQKDGTPKISDLNPFPDATLGMSADGSPDGVIFGNERWIRAVNAELETYLFNDDGAVPAWAGFISVLQSANLATEVDDTLMAILKTNQSGKPSILEMSSNAQVEVIYDKFDASSIRAKDAFLMNGEYATCAKETGATFLVSELIAGNVTPDRYPLINLGDIVSCEYDPTTDQVVLFSAENGVGFMDATGEVVRTLSPTEGHHIVNGSIW
jgi:hypothetical protein